MEGRSVKSFYGKKTSHHRFMQSAIDQVIDDESPADIILIGPPLGGLESDQEDENEDNVTDNGLPLEVSSELVVQQRDNDGENEQTLEPTHGTPPDQPDQLAEDEEDEEEEESSADDDEETDYTMRKWRANIALKKQQTQSNKQKISKGSLPPKRQRMSKQKTTSTDKNDKQSTDIPSSSTTSTSKTAAKKKKEKKVEWTKRHIKQLKEPGTDQDGMAQEVLVSNHPNLAGLTVWSSFELVFDDIIELLIEQTIIYGTRDKNKANFSVSKEEMSNFIGLLFLSGYNIRKSQKDYWSIDPDLGCSTFRETMSRNRFDEIKSCFHAADNNSLAPDTRMAKVKPLYDLVNEKLLQFDVVHESLSIDEAMVPYYGRHSCKQFIKAKPIRFGFKIWVLASATGMPYHLHIYEGKPAQKEEETLGSRVVKRALSVCKSADHHSVFFDNFFSSYKLLVDLKTMGFRATGTMRNDRIQNCPLQLVNDMKKLERGVHDHRSSADSIEIVRWNDNSVVTLGSNAYGLMPLGQAKRWKKGKGQVSVEQPAVIGHYNRGMGGVDLVDRALSDFRPSIHGKKWYWPLVVNALNIAFVYSWRLFRIVAGESMEQKLYRRQIVSILLRRSVPVTPAIQLHAPTVYKVADEIRLDGHGHYPESGPIRKCAVCKKNCRNICGKCKRSIHVKICFQEFHEK